jgi:hypothetical protein
VDGVATAPAQRAPPFRPGAGGTDAGRPRERVEHYIREARHSIWNLRSPMLEINADLYSAPAPGDPPPVANASMRTLFENIQRLKLDVDRHVGIHGVPRTHHDFLTTLGATR